MHYITCNAGWLPPTLPIFLSCILDEMVDMKWIGFIKLYIFYNLHTLVEWSCLGFFPGGKKKNGHHQVFPRAAWAEQF